MFIDYYIILEIDFDASQEQIKNAYKVQAIKWHPDKNAGIDTTIRMQQINEAYLMLKDEEARKKYNIEYIKFKEYQKFQKEQQKQKEDSNSSQNSNSKPFEDNSYVVSDDALNKWMSNARIQAVNLAKQTLEDIIGMSKVSGKAIGGEMVGGIIRLVVMTIIMAIAFKMCK